MRTLSRLDSFVRGRTLGFIIALVIIASVPLAMGYSYEYKAAARTAAIGDATILWGSPFLVPTISYGTGSAQVTMRGTVYPTPSLDGYYTYEEMRLSGRAHVKWSNGSDQYVLDTSISLLTENTAYMPTKIVPAANAFVVLGSEFTGTLVRNGNSEKLEGIAAVVAAAPGHFGFKGQYRSTTIVLYISNALQIVIAWSDSNQTVQGIYQPACSKLIQAVRLVG